MDFRRGSELYAKSLPVLLDTGRTVCCVELPAKDPSFLNIFFVHGSMGSASQFFPLMSALHEEHGYGCTAYDWFGCGRSPKPQDWEAYSFDAHFADLEAMWKKVAGRGRTLVVAHSYGTHLAMRLALSQQEEASTRAVTAASSVNSQMAGLVLLSGMLATQDGGHPIFRLPVFALDYLQPSLTASFLQMAFEPGCEPELLASQEAACNANPMHVCKAYYRQVRGLSAEAIRSLSTGPLPCWLAHGDADGVLPIAGAVALHAVLEPATRGELIVFPGASHNFILERAAAAADLLHEILQELATS